MYAINFIVYWLTPPLQNWIASNNLMHTIIWVYIEKIPADVACLFDQIILVCLLIVRQCESHHSSFWGKEEATRFRKLMQPYVSFS